MDETKRKKLQGILRKIDIIKKEVEELLGDESKKGQSKSEASSETRQIIDSINSMSANDLETKLNTLGHKELGDIFIGVGGSSGDKRKPKAWLIDRIIWLAKEFSEGHKAIRES